MSAGVPLLQKTYFDKIRFLVFRNVDAKSSYSLALTLLISVFSVNGFFILSLAFLFRKDIVLLPVSVNKILVDLINI